MSDKPRVLHLRASNFVGGPERQILRYAMYERNGDLEVVVGTLVGAEEGGGFLSAVEEHGIRSLALPAGGLGDAGAVRVLARFLKEQRIALICSHGYQADLMGVLAGRLGRVPVACFLRGWTGESRTVRLYEALDRTVLPLASRVVCLSETQARETAGRWGLRHKVRVVANVVDVPVITAEDRLRARAALRARSGAPADSPVIASAGRLSSEKGTAQFLRSMPAILERFSSARFVIFGDGPLRNALVRLAHTLNLTAAVHFAGFVSDWTEMLPGIDVLVNPSLSEVMPNTVLEALAAAVPVVATDVGGLREIGGPEGNVMLVPPNDPAAITTAVATFLQDRKRAFEFGLKGQMRVREAFSPVRQRAQLSTLYRELIPALRPRPECGLGGMRLPESAKFEGRSQGADA